MYDKLKKDRIQMAEYSFKYKRNTNIGRKETNEISYWFLNSMRKT